MFHKLIFVYGFSLLPFFAVCQKTVTKISDDSIINKWQSATINIETISVFTDEPETLSVIDQSGKSIHERDKLYDSLSKDKQDDLGTAIYFVHNGKHFLITARHVVADGFTYDTNRIQRKLLLIANRSDDLLKRTHTPATHPEWATLYFDPINHKHRYKFSSVNEDIAIICIDSLERGNEGQLFINTLKYRGYKPITLSDIDTLCNLQKDEKILTIGFPNFNWVNYNNKDYQFFGSGVVPPIKTIPQITTGVIVQSASNDYFFLSDILCYFGNSGGAVINYNNKMIGIVSRFSPQRKEANNPELKYYYETRMLFIKSSLIAPLLRNLMLSL